MEETPRPRYVAPTIWSLDSHGVSNLLGPVETQYGATVTVGESCLPVIAGNTVQDNWQITIPTDLTRVRVTVDVVYPNSSCASADNCAVAPDPARGPLDPKFAIYQPGPVSPGGEYVHPDCSVAATGELGCTTKPADACIVCDNLACGFGAAVVCATADVDLSPPGRWTIAVGSQAPSFVDQGQGCYVLTVESTNGTTGIGALALVNNDSTGTFLKGTVDKYVPD